MPELIIQALELVDVHHDHRHADIESPGALDLLRNAQFEESAIEDSGQAIQVGQLTDPVDVVRVLDGVRADVRNRLKRLLVVGVKCAHLGAVEHQHPECIPERNQWNAHASCRLDKKTSVVGGDSYVIFNHGLPRGEGSSPKPGSRRQPSTFRDARSEVAVVSPQHHLVFLF